MSSLAVIAVLVTLGCKEKPSPDTGMGAGAVAPDSSPPAVSTPPVAIDSAPWDPDPAGIDTTLPRPSTTTPARKDSTDSTRQRSSQTPAIPSTGTTMASGSTTPSSADAPLRDAYHKAPIDTVDGKTYQGWKYYNLNCARCHGEDVAGTTIAPHLITSLRPDGPMNTKELFIQTVCEGRVPKGMPAWCQTGMTPAEIDTIYAYVKGRSEAKLHPGRPARREG
jgi:mono/diheme cytochrome c family protein